MEETISLQDVLQTLKKRASLIVAITIATAIIAAIVSFFVLTPIYQATTQVLVTQQKNEGAQQITTAEIQSDLQLINTYNEIITSPAILSVVIENLDLAITPTQLKSKISVVNSNNSQVLNISLQDENYNVAVDLVNEIVKVFKDEVPDLMNVDNVNILAPAEKSENPVPIKPNKMLNIAIALVLGLMISIGLAFLLEYLDKTVKTERDVEELLGIPVIGLISPITDDMYDTQKVISRRRQVTKIKGN